MHILIKDDKEIDPDQILELYRANNWSSANKPENLVKGLKNSHSLVSAWYNGQLVGLGNALSDGYLVVYYPHLLVHPNYHGKGIGKKIMDRMQQIYGGHHMQILVADGKAIDFYAKCGFVKAGQSQSMWIYDGDEH